MRVPSAKAASVSRTPHAEDEERNSFSSCVICGSLLFALLAAGERLGGVAGCYQHQHRDRDDGDDDGQQHAAHLGPQLHDTGRGGHEQQREDAGQEQADLLHIVQLDEAQQQGSQQQDQAVDAGRDGQRQNSVAELAQKTERKDACELKQILRKKSPFIAPAQPPLRGSSAGE